VTSRASNAFSSLKIKQWAKESPNTPSSGQEETSFSVSPPKYADTLLDAEDKIGILFSGKIF